MTDPTHTIRQNMAELLEGGMFTAKDISRALGIREKEVIDHLPHVATSVEAKGKRLSVEPSECMGCGFVFRKRERFRTPSRCPVCKAEEITEARFGIV
ncbi:MAG: transcriptional regulator [Deltaproteobacteria bacterium]|nr:transcriptional regulator [Deltaproteobacteria bacterium]